MPALLVVIILGIVEGLTEFIPVSSTGHLLLAQQWLPRQSELFNVLIQSGAVLAIFPAFASRLRDLIFGIGDKANRDYVLKLVVAFLITGVGGLLLKKLGWKLPEEALPVAWATFIGGLIILGLEFWLRGRKSDDDVTWTLAVVFGLAQLVAAIFPGASRSGTTIMLALAFGLNRPRATEFSFLLGIPTLLAAGALESLEAIKKPVLDGPHTSMPMVLVGVLVSAVTAFLVVKWLIHFVQRHNFIGFAWYRIIFGAVLLAWFWPR